MWDILMERKTIGEMNMKKAILMAILSALILSSCGKVEEPTNDSRVTESASVTTSSAITEATSTEITDETINTTTTSSEEKKSTTTLKTTESKTQTSTSTKKTTVQAMQNNGGNTTRQNTTVENGNQGQNYQPEQTSPPQNIPAKNTTTTVKRIVTTTTAKPKPVTTTTARPKPVVTTTTTKKQEEKAEWSELMKAWKKLAMGQGLSSNEENLIRTDIIEYGLDKFNGKQTVTCTCGNDVTTVKFLSPLNMTANYSWNDFSRAHMDACSNAESSALIKMASSDKEVYSIVEQARNDCLSVIDNGVASWHYYCDINGVLKYASDLEFSVYIDGTYIWFLTK